MKFSLAMGFAVALSLAFPLVSMAQVHVSGYTKKDGTYVAPHMRSSPNQTKLDNYSTRGNVNPYTGQKGTVDPYRNGNSYSQPTPNPYGTTPAEDDEN
jgi:hypothetical protein